MTVALAIEWSTRRLSVATRTDAHFPVESSLRVERFHACDAMNLLEDHLSRHGLAPGDLTHLVLGRGPGNFSGIRLAFAWSAGCQAPGGLQLSAHSSGRVLAERLRRAIPAFYLLGDARRGYWWGCAVDASQIGDWELLPPETWRQRIGSQRVYSSDVSRLDGLEAVTESFPTAVDLLLTQQPTEVSEPLYLHPAV